jgi:hypothetical protein
MIVLIHSQLRWSIFLPSTCAEMLFAISEHNFVLHSTFCIISDADRPDSNGKGMATYPCLCTCPIEMCVSMIRKTNMMHFGCNKHREAKKMRCSTKPQNRAARLWVGSCWRLCCRGSTTVDVPPFQCGERSGYSHKTTIAS